MSTNITLDDAQAWVEPSKFGTAFATLNAALAEQESNNVIAQLAGDFNTSTWVSPTTTPNIVRRLISMRYAGWTYLRAGSENEEGVDSYGSFLLTQSDLLLAGILNGSVAIIGIGSDARTGSAGPSFYPNDASSSQEPTADDPSLGGPFFSMGRQW